MQVATFRGIAAVGIRILGLIDAACERDPFVQNGLTTTVIRDEDPKSRPFTFGVSPASPALVRGVIRALADENPRAHPFALGRSCDADLPSPCATRAPLAELADG